MHVDHNIDEFKAPFNAKSLQSCGFSTAETLTSSHVSMLRACLTASRAILDAFLAFAPHIVLVLPPHLYCARAIYALVLLIKLHCAIATAHTGIEKYIQREALGVENYLERLGALSQQVMREDRFGAQSRILLIVGKLKEWFYSRQRKVPGHPSTLFTETTNTTDADSPLNPAADLTQGEGLIYHERPSNLNIPEPELSFDDELWSNFLNHDIFDYDYGTSGPAK